MQKFISFGKMSQSLNASVLNVVLTQTSHTKTLNESPLQNYLNDDLCQEISDY